MWYHILLYERASTQTKTRIWSECDIGLAQEPRPNQTRTRLWSQNVCGFWYKALPGFLHLKYKIDRHVIAQELMALYDWGEGMGEP